MAVGMPNRQPPIGGWMLSCTTGAAAVGIAISKCCTGTGPAKTCTVSCNSVPAGQPAGQTKVATSPETLHEIPAVILPQATIVASEAASDAVSDPPGGMASPSGRMQLSS